MSACAPGLLGLQVEYPSCSWHGQPSSDFTKLHPIDAQLLREFWTLKEAVLPPASAFPPPQQQSSGSSAALDASYWGPAQLHPSRLSRSVSAQEFNTDAVERCVRAGQSGKSDGRVRLGRQSVATITSGAAPPVGTASRTATATTGRVPAPAPAAFLLPGLHALHTSLPGPVSAAAGGAFASTAFARSATTTTATTTSSRDSPPLPLPSRSSCDIPGGGGSGADAAAAECKQHGGRSEAMDRRVRGGRLLRSQSKDPNFVSVLSLLDTAVGAAAGPQTPSRSDVSTAATAVTCPAHAGGLSFTAAAAAGGFSGGAPAPAVTSPFSSQPAGFSLGRLYSLDSATLHQLDRALSGASELRDPSGGSFGAVGLTSPVSLGPATASAPPPGGLGLSGAATAAASGAGGRIYKVRPLGAAASSLSLHSSCPLGSPFSRCNSTLLDFAEEQASLAAVQQSLGGGGGSSGGAAAGHVDYLALLSANNSASGGGAAGAAAAGGGGSCFGGYGGSYPSSAAGSLSASPNPHQPHVSLATLLGAAAANGRASSGGRGGGGGGAAAAAAVGCSMPLPLPRNSLPAEVGRQGRALAAPDMRLFPFSSPEDFYMAATVLLDAKLPGAVLLPDAAASPPDDGDGVVSCE